MYLGMFLVLCVAFTCSLGNVVTGLRVKTSSLAFATSSFREETDHLHFLLSYNATLRPTDKVQLVLNDRTILMQPLEDSLDTWEVRVDLPLTHMGAVLSHSCQRYFFQTDSKEVSQREKRTPETDYFHTNCDRNSAMADSSFSTLFASAVLYTILIGYLYL